MLQRFNKSAAVTNCGMLMLATIMLIFPDIMENSHDISECRCVRLPGFGHSSAIWPTTFPVGGSSRNILSHPGWGP